MQTTFEDKRSSEMNVVQVTDVSKPNFANIDINFSQSFAAKFRQDMVYPFLPSLPYHIPFITAYVGEH